MPRSPPENSTTAETVPVPAALATLIQAATAQHFVMEKVPDSTVYRFRGDSTTSLDFFRPAAGRRGEPRRGMHSMHTAKSDVCCYSLSVSFPSRFRVLGQVSSGHDRILPRPCSDSADPCRTCTCPECFALPYRYFAW